MDPIGRDGELALVTGRLRDRRLVTLVGPGGIGKTTLARAALHRCRDHFGEGIRTVDLSRVRSADGVRESVAGQLGYASYTALLESPGDHEVLILMDGCEPIVDEVAGAVEDLLAVCELPTILATSRMALELPGETVVPVGPLGLPPHGRAEGPAVRLFLERARDAGAEIEPSEAVAELCRRLDGVPLAIELAAARARSMAPAEILARLDAGIGVLDRPRRRGARRHQSLRETVAWSHDLLDEPERATFDRLSVFSGPFTASLAHAVVGEPGTDVSETQDRLDALVSASMVVADTSAEVTWYRQLDTLRAFAAECLDARGERLAVEAAFADHLLGRVADLVARGAATWSADVLGELLALYDNVAAAVRWCVEHDTEPDRALLLTAALWAVIHQAHTEDIGALAQQVLERWPDTDHELHADAAATAATCRYMMGDHDGAVALATASLAAAERSPFAAVTLRRALGQSTRATGDLATSQRWFQEAATEGRRRGLVGLAVEADAARAQILADRGRLDEALALVRAAHAEAGAAGSPVAAAWARTIEGSVLLRADLDQAEEVLADALATSRELGYAAGISTNLRSLALAAQCRDEPARAAQRLLELLDELLRRGSTYELRLVVETAAPLVAATGRAGPAADLATTARTLPVVSITASVGHELFPLPDGRGTTLGATEAILLVQDELRLLAASEAGAGAGAEVRPGAQARVGGDARAGAVGGTGGEGATGPETRAAVGAAATAASAGSTSGASGRGGPAVAGGVFRPVGESWEVGLDGHVVTMRATKGLADLARLLARPEREVHCLELIGGVAESDTGEVLDPAARRAYEDRIRELQAELDEADDANDLARSARAQSELDALVEQLTSALGLGGRGRRTGGAAERARSTVTQRIRTTMKRVEEVHPTLGRHLKAAIRTGTFCSYQPERPVHWQLD